jgi:uncharacterized membrane protein YhaH (DUF805 family)
MKASVLGWSWLGLKVLAFVLVDLDAALMILSFIELPLLVYWLVTAIRELRDNKKQGWLIFQIIIAGLFLILWLVFFAIGVTIGMGEV